MDLIIVESPTKARTLSRFLGSDYVVQATMGHIKDLPKSKLGVDVEKNFAPDYVVVEKRGKEIKSLGKDAKKEAIAEKAIKLIEEKAHTSGLTEKVKEFLEKETGAKLKVEGGEYDQHLIRCEVSKGKKPYLNIYSAGKDERLSGTYLIGR